MSHPFAFDTPDDAIDAIAERLSRTDIETNQPVETGRVLAKDQVSERESPAANVSAMDGYAIRLQDIAPEKDLPVSSTSYPGSPPPEMAAGQVTRIFTGAMVPSGADAVIKREDTEESDTMIRLREVALTTDHGMHIRFAGENLTGGEVFLRSGSAIATPQAAALMNFGIAETDLFAKVRVTIMTTGDELVQDATSPVEPWQIRNSNRTALQCLLARHGWMEEPKIDHVRDNREELRDRLAERLNDHDAVVLTGGVSMGDHDFVPGVIDDVGGQVVFHKLPLRPGKPILGAVGPRGQLILGLPGNPVSAMMGAVRFGLPLLRRISGQRDWRDIPPKVRLSSPGEKTLPLHWMRGVRMLRPGVAAPVIGKGSGDLVALASTDGFIEMPPGATGEGPWPYRTWS